ncbi:MAG: TolC family protein [Myxococcales bacterium]|nr:TolC family protein [Myxococcales bacterium]HQY65091.1 TolC family protein [Polyangiaceae bacterium]
MKLLLPGAALASLLLSSEAWAEPSCTTITRENVAMCAVSASLPVRAAAFATTARRADVERAKVLLPSNPILALSFAGRRSTDDSAFNAYGQLGQELELGGQRSARTKEARARVVASESHRSAAEREVAAEALAGYFEVLAAREESVLFRRVETLALRVADTARAQANAGAVSEVDADVGEAQAAKRTHARIVAEGHLAAAEVRLARLVGASGTTVPAEGSLRPLALPARNEPSPRVAALTKEAEALDAQASGLARSRVPNITVSVFAQSDGFRERVLGAGLSLPIPLPEPLGRSRSSEIAGARAEAERTRAEAEGVRIALAREADAFQAETTALLQASAVVDDARAARAEASLAKLAEEVERGRMHARDAFVAQDALADLLAQRIAAKRAACIASVRLAALRGVALERGTP